MMIGEYQEAYMKRKRLFHKRRQNRVLIGRIIRWLYVSTSLVE